MGLTYAILIENSLYDNLEDAIYAADEISRLALVLDEYQFDSIIILKNFTYDGLSHFFWEELNELIRTNGINAILIWISGREFVKASNRQIYLASDAPPDSMSNSYDYYAHFLSIIPQSLERHNSIDHILLISNLYAPSSLIQYHQSFQVINWSCDNSDLIEEKSFQVLCSRMKYPEEKDVEFFSLLIDNLESNNQQCISINEIEFSIKKKWNDQNGRKANVKSGYMTRYGRGTFFFLRK